MALFLFAGVHGLEPRYSGPKPDVLPLDDTPIFCPTPFDINVSGLQFTLQSLCSCVNWEH